MIGAPNMNHPYSNRKPIRYDYVLDIRFSDLDPYGHLNSTLYLDLINTSRMLYLERERGFSIADVVKRGIGFYMTRANQEFLKSVKGFQKLRAVTEVSDVQGGKLTIPYELKSEDGEKLYSKGILEYAVIDLKTQKPTDLPDWLADQFFYPLT